MPVSRAIIDRTLATPLGESGYRVVERLLDAGEEAWWVGGAVRDLLLNGVPEEIDIATSATPERVTEIFDDATVVGDLGASRVTLDGHTFELTTFREEDPESDGRHPERVIYTTRDRDAARRDFTVSCLYWQPVSSELYDPFGGERDLEERLVRFIGEPSVRIAHDALRLLRAVRLCATIDGQYEPATFDALRQGVQRLTDLSGSRVLQEMEKLLLCSHSGRALRDWLEIGIMPVLLPEISACQGVPQPRDYHREGDVLEHLLRSVESALPEEEIDVRIAALLHDIGKVDTYHLAERIRFDEHASVSAEKADAILLRLQCPARRREKITWLIRHHMHMSFLELSDDRKRHWYFHPWFAELLQLFRLDIAGTVPPDFTLYAKIVHDRDVFLDAHPRPEKPLLNGNEIMELLQLQSGEEIGRLSRELLVAQHERRVTSKAEAVAFLRGETSA